MLVLLVLVLVLLGLGPLLLHSMGFAGNTRAIAAAVFFILPAAAALLMSGRRTSSRPRPKRRERKDTYTAANPLRCHVLRAIRPEDKVLLSKLLNDNVKVTCVDSNSPEQCVLPEGDDRVDVLVHGFKGEIVSKVSGRLGRRAVRSALPVSHRLPLSTARLTRTSFAPHPPPTSAVGVCVLAGSL